MGLHGSLGTCAPSPMRHARPQRRTTLGRSTLTLLLTFACGYATAGLRQAVSREHTVSEDGQELGTAEGGALFGSRRGLAGPLKRPAHLGAAELGAAGYATGAPSLRIPRILHHVFIPDASDPTTANLDMWPQHVLWVETCKHHFSPRAGWQYMYWNASTSEQLIAEHYPYFLDFFRKNITLANEKSDIMRYLLMHRFGGVYLDSDVQCFREAADTLEGWDVVLQGTHAGEGVGSAAMASAPGVPLWIKTLELVKERNFNASVEQPEWYKSLERTGPNLLRDTLLRVGLEASSEFMFKENQTVDGLVYRINPAGSWFLLLKLQACQWFEDDCRKRVYEDLASGQMDLRNVVGMHRFAGSWIPEKNNDKGRVDVKLELCARDLSKITIKW